MVLVVVVVVVVLSIQCTYKYTLTQTRVHKQWQTCKLEYTNHRQARCNEHNFAKNYVDFVQVLQKDIYSFTAIWWWLLVTTYLSVRINPLSSITGTLWNGLMRKYSLVRCSPSGLNNEKNWHLCTSRTHLNFAIITVFFANIWYLILLIQSIIIILRIFMFYKQRILAYFWGRKDSAICASRKEKDL